MAWSIFCKVDGIEGSNTRTGHESEIEVMRFDYFVSHPVAQGEEVGAHHHADVTIEKASDKSSSKLFQRCVQAAVLSKVEFKFYRQSAGGEEQEYCKITLKNTIVSNWHVTAALDDTAHPGLREVVSFAFSEIEIDGPEMGPAEDTFRNLRSANVGNG